MGQNRLGYRDGQGLQIVRTAFITSRVRRMFLPNELDALQERVERAVIPPLKVRWMENISRYVLEDEKDAPLLEALMRAGFAMLSVEVISEEAELDDGVVIEEEEEDA